MSSVIPYDDYEDQKVRCECAIRRTHQRFLLRTLQFSQQYAPMYRNRIESQHAHALQAIVQSVRRDHSLTGTTRTKSSPPLLRVLELSPGTPSLCVGVVYKNMRLLPKFLDLYQRELVRVDAGGDDGEGDGDAIAAELPLTDTVPPPPQSMMSAVSATNKSGADGGDESWVLASMDEHYTVSDDNDELTLEDSSGQIVLTGLDTARFCTGVVLGVYGTLLANGTLRVIRYAFSGLDSIRVPRCHLTHTLRPSAVHAPDVSSRSSHEPCYIAFVCGLSITGDGTASDAALSGSSSSAPASLDGESVAEERAARQRSHAMLSLLLDFVCGNLGDAAMQEQARHISRLVIGGNSIARTEELQLKKKVRLDHTDYTRLNEDKTSSKGASSVDMMRAFDAVLAQLCASVEVELMPGDMDMSDAFFPQQPLHPVLLPRSSRFSTLRLVTNPYTFTALPDHSSTHSRDGESSSNDVKVDGGIMDFNPSERRMTGKHNIADDRVGVHFFVTSGQNVNDLARETRFASRLDAMQMILQSGCACPTAPNTLFSYPFHNSDPFLFTTAPHCLVACDQPRFETCFVTPAQLNNNTSRYYHTSSTGVGKVAPGNSAHESQTHRDEVAANGTVTDHGDSNKTMKLGSGGAAGHARRDEANEEEKVDVDVDGAGEGKGEDDLYNGTRIISVPSFDRSGIVVLVDIHSPSLHTTMIDFSMK